MKSYNMKRTCMLISLMLLFVFSCSSIYKKTAGGLIDLINAMAESPKILIENFSTLIYAVILFQEQNKAWPRDQQELSSFSEKKGIPVKFEKFRELRFVEQSGKRLNIRYNMDVKSDIKDRFRIMTYIGIIGIYTPDPAKSILKDNYVEIYIMKVIYSEKKFHDNIIKQSNPFILYIKNFNRIEWLKTKEINVSGKQGKFYFENVR